MTSMTQPLSAKPESGGARTFIRRLYFYGMALVSFIVALFALDNLLRVLTQAWLEPAVPGLTIDAYTAMPSPAAVGCSWWRHHSF